MMPPTAPRPTRSRPPSNASAALVAALLLLSACADRDEVARVGKTSIRAAEVAAYQRGDGDAAAALERLADRALLAEAARRDGLADDAALRARIAIASRELLAQAWLDRRVAAATREDLLRARFDREKAKLTRREVKVAHLVVRAAEGDRAARERARSAVTLAQAELAGGRAFEALPAALEKGAAVKPEVAALGWVREGTVDATFFAAAAALRDGEVSPPVETPYGVHLLKALAPPRSVEPEFEAVRGQLAAAAGAEAAAAARDELRKTIDVALHPERLPTAGPPAAGAN